MHRITLILILCLLLPDMYIYLVYIVKRTRSILWRSVYWLPTVVLVAPIFVLYLYGRRECSFPTSPKHRQAGCSCNAVCRSEDRIYALFAAWHIDAGNQPPFVIHHFPYAVQESPYSFCCPPASLHTSRADIGDNRFCQYPLRSNSRHQTF